MRTCPPVNSLIVSIRSVAATTVVLCPASTTQRIISGSPKITKMTRPRIMTSATMRPRGAHGRMVAT